MINLKSEEKKEKEMPLMSSMEYPYGLRLILDHETLEKLGIKELPQMGAKVNIEAIAEVVSVSACADHEGEIENTICLQITDMDLKKQSAAKKIYGE